MTPDQLTAIAGALLSLLFSYAPGLSDRYAALDGTYKRIVMLVALFAVCVGLFAGSCFGLGAKMGFEFACTSMGAADLVSLFIYALIANQATFLASPQKK